MQLSQRSIILMLVIIGQSVGALLFPAAASESVQVLSGTLTSDDRETYQELPFAVPEGVKRITVSLEYDRDKGTVIDLGIFDPRRFRGWSGSNKAAFTLAETDATPSYLPGPLPAGEWTLILGIPEIREAAETSYRAEITLESGALAGARSFADAALDDKAGWYRGELHAHTGHSDGSCRKQSGAAGPCPVYRTVEAAAAQGLDFIAITEHNARSHHQSLRELQISFDQMLLMSGREITTFYGHVNVFGSTEFIDFRAQNKQINPILADAKQRGGLVSINHPGLGWAAETDYSLVDAVEIVNGSVIDYEDGALKGRLSSIPFWERLLNAGHRVTGIAGTDNHNAELLSSNGPRAAIGGVSTVIYAESLAQADLLKGLQSGRVFIDLEGSADRLVDMQASAAGAKAVMGSALSVAAGEDITLTVTIKNVRGAKVVLVRDGKQLLVEPDYAVDGNTIEATTTLASSGKPGWVRAEVLADTDGEAGKVLLLSNPVYLRAP